MTLDRRDFLIGGAAALAAASAYAARPRENMALLGDLELDKLIPDQFAGWQARRTDQIVAPQNENSLANRLYNQQCARIFSHTDGSFVMMLIAYGNTQNDLLQLHRPEVCYQSFGFEIAQSREITLPLAGKISLPARELTAVSNDRTEYVTYWTRIGQEMPTSGRQQQLAKLQSQLRGIIPDGALIRFSSLNDDPEAAFATNRALARDFIAALSAKVRPALIGTARATQFAALYNAQSHS